MPMQKNQVWTANFSLEDMEVTCGPDHGLSGATHQHKQIRGSHKIEGEGWMSIASRSGRYTAEQALAYLKCASRALENVERNTWESDPDCQLVRAATTYLSTDEHSALMKRCAEKRASSSASSRAGRADPSSRPTQKRSILLSAAPQETGGSKLDDFFNQHPKGTEVVDGHVKPAPVRIAPDGERLAKAADAGAGVLVREEELTEKDRAAIEARVNQLSKDSEILWKK